MRDMVTSTREDGCFCLFAPLRASQTFVRIGMALTRASRRRVYVPGSCIWYVLPRWYRVGESGGSASALAPYHVNACANFDSIALAFSQCTPKRWCACDGYGIVQFQIFMLRASKVMLPCKTRDVKSVSVLRACIYGIALPTVVKKKFAQRAQQASLLLCIHEQMTRVVMNLCWDLSWTWMGQNLVHDNLFGLLFLDLSERQCAVCSPMGDSIPLLHRYVEGNCE